MVGVSQNNFRIDVFFQLPLMHTLHRSGGAHWHKNGRTNCSVVGGDFTSAGVAFGVFGSKRKFHGRKGLDDYKVSYSPVVECEGRSVEL